MATVEDVVIVGAGLAGLATAVGLHRGKHEVRCVKRNLLLETLAKELPQGTIRYSSKLVSIDEEADEVKRLHLIDGSEDVVDMIEKSKIGSVVSSPLRYRWPFELLWGNISKGNVCVAGDALHPMTPDLGQGGCSALEDGVVLARCLGEALSGGGIDGQNDTIKNALAKYAEERKWRSFQLVATSYVLGFIQQSDHWLLNFLRDKCLSEIMAKQYLKKADFDCGKI